MRDFDARLLRLKQALHVTEDKDVAEALGLTKEAFSRRKTRDSFPEDKVRALAQQRPEVDADFVLFGHGAEAMRARREGGHTVFISSGAGEDATVREVVKRYLAEPSARDRLVHNMPVTRQELYAELSRALDGLDDATLILLFGLVERLTAAKSVSEAG